MHFPTSTAVLMLLAPLAIQALAAPIAQDSPSGGQSTALGATSPGGKPATDGATSPGGDDPMGGESSILGGPSTGARTPGGAEGVTACNDIKEMDIQEEASNILFMVCRTLVGSASSLGGSTTLGEATGDQPGQPGQNGTGANANSTSTQPGEGDTADLATGKPGEGDKPDSVTGKPGEGDKADPATGKPGQAGADNANSATDGKDKPAAGSGAGQDPANPMAESFENSL
ncbi:MAG: hypothetical protein Q9210_006058 [Variospora velana]